MYEKLSKLESRGTYSKNVPELLNNVPFVQLDFIVSELHLTRVGNLVDCILVFVGELEHIIGGIPASTDITGIMRGSRESSSKIQNHQGRAWVVEFLIVYASLQICGVHDYQILHKIS
jgi:hypothetical protein